MRIFLLKDDAAAENAITKALNDCKEKLVKLQANETVRLSDYKVEIVTSVDSGSVISKTTKMFKFESIIINNLFLGFI